MRSSIPIYIFQGQNDANCPAEGVYDLRDRFQKAGKKNLHVFVFDGENHDLDYLDWITKKEMPPGIKSIFASAAELAKQ